VLRITAQYLPSFALILFATALFAQSVTVPATPYALKSGSAQMVGRFNPQQMLRLVLALQPPHIQEEEAFLRELQDPDSPNFHQFLTEEQWNARFAPSEQDEQAVVQWAQSQGLTITARFPNRLLVDVEAPVATIEKAFNVSINAYQVGTDSKFSNDRDPSIPASLANIVHAVLGMNNFQMRQSYAKVKNLKPRTNYPVYSPGPAYAVGPHLEGDGDPEKLPAEKRPKKLDPFYSYAGYDPTDLYGSTAYDYDSLRRLGHCCNPLNNPNNSPREASIVIDIFDDFADSDYAGFLATYPYLAHNVQRYFIDGNSQCDPHTDPGCGVETTLDVEWATAMANSFGSSAATAKIHVYESADPSFATGLDAVNRELTDGKARVLNMSWGAAEYAVADRTTMDSYHNVFNQMVGQGWSLVAASGDQGSTTACFSYLYVSWPASDPDVTAVGGTTISTTVDYFSSETTWTGDQWNGACSYNDGGSGGGCSFYYAAPDYQRGVGSCGAGHRSVPDVALNAGAWQSFFYQGGLQSVGGTSVASPEVAGAIAQNNAYLLYLKSIVGDTCGSSYSAPCAPMGSANPYIYREARYRTAPHYPFYDITTECAINDINVQYHIPYYCSVPGFDQATGWGSLNVFQLAWTINDFLAGDGRGPSISVSGPMLNYWYTTDQTVSWTLTDNGGSRRPPIGVAGATLWWDNDPGDANSEPTPGSGNGFYGPWSSGANGTANLSAAGQGCHYARVRAWDNSGKGAYSSYGPVCFDNMPPTMTVQFFGDCDPAYLCNGPVQVVMTCDDGPGSGCASITYHVDEQSWQTYTGPFYVYVPGTHFVYFNSTDRAGNSGTPTYDEITVLSNTQYTVSVVKSGTGSGAVTSSDGAINCGPVCSASFWYEQPITLTATANPGSAFIGWRNCDQSYGPSCLATVTAARTITAVFNIPQALQFMPVTPCRVVDTRGPNGPFGGPSLAGGTARDFAIPSGPCPGIPSNAAAYSVNVTAVPNHRLSYLTAWPAGFTQPFVSILNSYDGRVKANAAIVPAGDNHAVSVYVTDTSDVIIDINGYFVASGSSALTFFPMTPCRVADTRGDNGPLGGPYLHNQESRDLPVLTSACNIPATAQAYSLNFTASPRNHAHLGYLTVWPTGQNMPVVSTLNAPTGTVTANAAIVPAGQDGDISVYAFGADTDVIVDIDGYFALHDSEPNPLSLYVFAPCRVLDTRNAGGSFTGELTVQVVNSPCQVPTAARAYVMNATVVPSGRFGYLTLWPDGLEQPMVSTLNAYDGAVTSNMAIVPGGNGSIDAYASDLANLILDISSYFAP
jgi:hypothetical protein